MRISVTSGDRTVCIKIKGSSPELIADVEAAARRLLASTPEHPARQPFGFALTSDAEAAPQPGALELGGDES